MESKASMSEKLSFSLRQNPYQLPLTLLLLFGGLSLVLHLGLIYSANFVNALENAESNPFIQVPNLQVNILETITTEQETAEAAPANPRFASDRNLRTEIETSPESAPSQLPQRSGNRSPQQSGGRKVFSLGAGDLVADASDQDTSAGSVGGPDRLNSPGFMRRLQIGDELKANAAQFDYAQYIERMRAKIAQVWDPLSTVENEMYRYNEVEVIIALVLDSQGNIEVRDILNSSRFRRYDDEAIEALMDAAPFPNPPDRLIQDDGKVYMTWSFVLSFGQWGARRVR